MAKSVEVFTKIGFAAIGVGVLLLALSPVLKAWMHEGKTTTPDAPEAPDIVPVHTPN